MWCSLVSNRALIVATIGMIAGLPGSGAGADDVLSEGARLYKAHCAVCHGANLEGQPDWKIRKPDGRLPAPPHDKTGHTWHHPDQHLFIMIKKGIAPPLAPVGYESDMPAFEGVLSDNEMWSVLAFIKSTWPARYRNKQRNISEQAGGK